MQLSGANYIHICAYTHSSKKNNKCLGEWGTFPVNCWQKLKKAERKLKKSLHFHDKTRDICHFQHFDKSMNFVTESFLVHIKTNGFILLLKFRYLGWRTLKDIILCRYLHLVVKVKFRCFRHLRRRTLCINLCLYLHWYSFSTLKKIKDKS